MTADNALNYFIRGMDYETSLAELSPILQEVLQQRIAHAAMAGIKFVPSVRIGVDVHFPGRDTYTRCSCWWAAALEAKLWLEDHDHA